MSVAIRLARGGAKKRPYYRIVVTNSRSARDGRFIEKIGTYNPLLAKDSPDRIKLDAERARHWLSVGAQPSDRVLRFLDAAGVMERTARNNPKKGEQGEKEKERAEARASKLAEVAAATAPVEEPAPEPTPVEEPAPSPFEEPLVVAEPSLAEPSPAEPSPAEPSPAASPEATVSAESGDGEATPASDAPNAGASDEDPAEGSDVAAPAEGAEKGTD